MTRYGGTITITLSGFAPQNGAFSATLSLTTRLDASMRWVLLPAPYPSLPIGLDATLAGAGQWAVTAGDTEATAEAALPGAPFFTMLSSLDLPVEGALAGLSVAWTETSAFNAQRTALTYAAMGTFTGVVGGIEASGTIQAAGTLATTSTAYSIAPLGSTYQLEGDTGSTVFRYTVTRLGNLSGAGNVAWHVEELVDTTPWFLWPGGRGVASGADFVGGSFPQGVATFRPGEAQATLEVAVQGGTEFELDEGFRVVLETPADEVMAAERSASGVIANDDLAILRIGAVDADRLEGGTGEIAISTFRITRTGIPEEPVSVRWDVLGDSMDFAGAVLPGGVVTFLPGETSAIVEVPVAGDGQAEGNDGYRVNLSSPTGGIVANTDGFSWAYGMILNDDGGPADIADSTAADEIFDLGEGDDLVRFSAPREQYHIGVRDNRVLVVGPDGTDELVDVEYLAFGTEPAKPVWHFAGTGADELMRFRAGDEARHLMFPQHYAGPLDLAYVAAGDARDNWLDGTPRNDFANLGDGNDAAQMWGGNDIVDGGGGNNFLTGGEGQDSFFLDGRFAVPVWSCISDWELGESLVLWGWQPGTSVGAWGESAGLPGYLGATFFADIDGSGAVETVVTFAGRGVAEMPLPTMLGVSGIGVLKFG